MNVSFNSNLSFKRAFSTREMTEYKKLVQKAREKLGIEETGSIAFDFNMPAYAGQNYGLGTMNSNSALDFIDFLQGIASVNKIQAGPQSELYYHSNGSTFAPVTSPYSGSTFTLGSHTISLDKLTLKEYGSILDDDYIESLDKCYPDSKDRIEYKSDYNYTLGKNRDGVLFQALYKAFDNFKQGVLSKDPDILRLNGEFETFKENMTEDVRKEILYDILSGIYHKKGISSVPENWDYTDRYLFSGKIEESKRQKRIKELEGPEYNGEFLKFCKFLALKQHNETKDAMNKKGVKLFGDCLVCFSNKEVWANPECFIHGWYTGGKDPFCPETNGIQPWGSPALNYDLLGEFDENGNIVELKETGKLLYRKFKNFMELYDGIRMDAFWQYVSPFIYNDNLEGVDVSGIEDKIIKIMEMAAKDSKNGFKEDRFVLELIGFNTERGKELTKNVFPHVYSTAYAEYNENPEDLIKNQGYRDGFFIIGATSHDNDSLVNMSRDDSKVELHTPILKRNLKEGYNHLSYKSENYKKLSRKEKIRQDFRTAKFAETFTVKKQYFTLPDMFGMEERINISGKTDEENWTVRIPSDYERFYYTQLSKGYGLNFPKCYSAALYSKNCSDNNLLQKLDDAAEILASDGPMTAKEADILEEAGTLGKTLSFNV